MASIALPYTLRYDAPPARLWPVVSNTDLLSEVYRGFPYQADDELQADGSVLRRGHVGLGPVRIEWLEDFGEWAEQRYLRQRRDIVKGPRGTVLLEARLHPDGDGSRIDFVVTMAAPGAAGWLIKYLGLGRLAAWLLQRWIDRLVQAELARPANDDTAPPLNLVDLGLQPHVLGGAARQRLDETLAAVAADTGLAAPARALADHLLQAPESALHRIRPLTLARAWGVAPEDAVRLCLAAQRHGLLRLQWQVLCPRCRGSKDSLDNLSNLPKRRHCSTCNIDYEQDFSHNVELIFTPEPWLRPLRDGAFCMMGTASVPHIKLQRRVGAGETLDAEVVLGPGSYRLRTAEAGPEAMVDWDGADGFPSIGLHADTVETGPPSPSGIVRLRNDTGLSRTVVIEELAWRADALTGDRAIALPAFRQYCPDQLLRPGDDVAIGNVVLMFTDLKGSTSLYEAIGDAAAYNLVRDHFDYLTGLIERHHGTLVKTIGDAVMAAFADPGDAVAAALAAQAGVERFNAGRTDGGMVLKLGLHQGACIAVTAGNTLDYFGATVNLAARLQGESRGGDIVMSDEVMAAPGIAAAIDGAGAGRTQETAQLRGVARPVAFWRVDVAGQDGALTREAGTAGG